MVWRNDPSWFQVSGTGVRCRCLLLFVVVVVVVVVFDFPCERNKEREWQCGFCGGGKGIMCYSFSKPVLRLEQNVRGGEGSMSVSIRLVYNRYTQ